VENISSSKLFTTRQGTILLGVIAAVIAAIALLVYLNHYRNNVNSHATVSVLVATHYIQQGTSGEAVARTNQYTTAAIPKGQVEKGAFVDPATLNGKVALSNINPQQQITEADFGPATGSLPEQLTANERAVVVSLGSPQTVGGQITAGSHVDLWVTFSGQSGNGSSRPIVKLLYQDMYVLGLNGSNVTFRATPTQAGALIYAAQNATIWLTLRPTNGTTPKPPVISAAAVVGG
jgi:pilus assembly protein CpaB